MTFATTIRRILLYWFLFLVVLNILVFLPHFPVHFLSWVNYSLYFMLFLFSLQIAIKEKYMKTLFFLFAFAFLSVVLSIITIYAGPSGLFGDRYTLFALYFYTGTFSYSMICAATVLFCLIYFLPGKSPLFLLAIALFVGFLFMAPHFIHQSSLTAYADEASHMGWMRHMLKIDLLGILLLCLYFALALFTNRPAAALFNAWALCLLTLFSFDIFDSIVSLGNIKMYGFDQYFAIIILIAMNIVLFFRLTALFSESHMMREQLIFDKKYRLNTAVHIADSQNSALFEQAKSLTTNNQVIMQFVTGLGIVLLAGLTSSYIVTFKVALFLALSILIWNAYTLLVKPKKHGETIKPQNKK